MRTDLPAVRIVIRHEPLRQSPETAPYAIVHLRQSPSDCDREIGTV